MTATLEDSYRPLKPIFSESGYGDIEETPHDAGVMIHVVPESNRARFHHVEDLDAFFQRMYHYHAMDGLRAMMNHELSELMDFTFIVVFAIFMFHGVEYSLLFNPNRTTTPSHRSIVDFLVPPRDYVASFGFFTWVCLGVATVFWAFRVVKAVYHYFNFLDIKCFYNTALYIEDNDLQSVTWYEIQRRTRDVQRVQQMCIHKTELSELDIYHRILRFKNYMVAMVNKNLLPPRLQIPFVGEVVYFTQGLKYNVELLLFWGPWAPFENWHLKEDYKKAAKRQEMAAALRKHIAWIAVVNLALCPLILVFQMLYNCFIYSEIIKRDVSTFGTRCWSHYGRLTLRHLNELDHELTSRLNRARKPANLFMTSYASPAVVPFARSLMFMSGSILIFLLVLTLLEEELLQFDHVLATMTALGAVTAACRAYIPDENVVRYSNQRLLTKVMAHLPYLSSDWRDNADSPKVRKEFSQMFQYRVVSIIEDILSPIMTPYLLMFHIRPRALEFIDFFRNFTVEVVGVGDVCSFAQMDIRSHGNASWQAGIPIEEPSVLSDGSQSKQSKPSAGKHSNQPSKNNEQSILALPKQYRQAENGKTELSLVHFTLTNPSWKPPPEAESFVNNLRNKTVERLINPAANIESDMDKSVLDDFLEDASTGKMEEYYCGPLQEGVAKDKNIKKLEGPLCPKEPMNILRNASLGASMFGPSWGSTDVPLSNDGPNSRINDMTISSLFLYEQHGKRGSHHNERSSAATWEKHDSRGRGDARQGGSGAGGPQVSGASGAAGASGALSGPAGPSSNLGSRVAERTPLLGGDYAISSIPSIMQHYRIFRYPDLVAYGEFVYCLKTRFAYGRALRITKISANRTSMQSPDREKKS